MRAVYDALACGVIVQDSPVAIVFANRFATRAQADPELVGPPMGFDRVTAGGARLLTSQLPYAIVRRTREPVRGVAIGIRRADGAIRWWLVDAVPLIDASGEITEIVSSFIDATEQREAETALRDQALRDALTQLPNRALFLDRLEVAIATAVREHTPLALMLLDLDHFKEVNDTFGHQAGDELLRQVATRFDGAIRKSDSLGRLGGDEFAFVLPGANELGAHAVARAILESLLPAFTIEGQPLELGGSIGVALFPRHGEDGETLLRRADIAMYTAKRSGTGVGTYDFEDERDDAAGHRLTLVAELRHGLDTGELALLYQPILDFETGRGARAEALARWRHPTRGLVLPSEFIGAAERSGLIRPLFEAVVRTALTDCATWRAAGLDLRVSVNLSARNLVDPSIADAVAQALERSGLTAAWLGFEITETMLMADPERSLRTLMRLRNMGLHLSIDDFGVGYSSLTYLQRLPVYAVKIDRSFIGDMLHDSSSRTIVKATVDLAHGLGLKVVAEGVENRETFDILAAMGCDSVQGYHIGRPMTSAKMLEWAVRNRDERIVELDELRARRLRRDLPTSVEESETGKPETS